MFKLKRDGSGYSVLHHFTGYIGGEDGSAPQGVVEGSDGALYGTTESGGLPGDDLHPTGRGTIFKVKKDGSGYTVLHSFLRSETDGFKPMAGLLAGSDGALYGTTDAGGSGHSGTVFRLAPDGSDYKLLHSFAVERSDGRFPRSSLVEGRDGTLYGTTENGGTRDAGTVFKLNKDGSGYRLLRSFTGSLGLKPDPQGLMQGVSNGVTTKFSDAGEGMGPTGLVQGSDGALYGTTEHHGKNGGGTLFRLNPDGGNFAVLHNFPVAQGDGQNPWAKMVHGSDGSILGTTKICSTNNFGTVFRLSISGSNPEPTPRSK